MKNNELARNYFHSLIKDNLYKYNYIVLNDGCYYTNFVAESDEEAIKIFNNKEYMENK